MRQGETPFVSLPLDAGGRSLNVLVTGTSRGIGRVTAELFLARGHRVWGLERASSFD